MKCVGKYNKELIGEDFWYLLLGPYRQVFFHYFCSFYKKRKGYSTKVEVCYISRSPLNKAILLLYREIEKWLSQDAHNVQIVGSNPTLATKCTISLIVELNPSKVIASERYRHGAPFGFVVQWLSRLTVYQEIIGSNPIGVAIMIKQFFKA